MGFRCHTSVNDVSFAALGVEDGVRGLRRAIGVFQFRRSWGEAFGCWHGPSLSSRHYLHQEEEEAAAAAAAEEEEKAAEEEEDEEEEDEEEEGQE